MPHMMMQPQMMMMQPHMQPQMSMMQGGCLSPPPGPPGMQTPGEGVAPTKARTKITTGSIPLSKMPNKHKLDCIEVIIPELDSTLTGNLSGDDLTVILYLVTRTRMDMKLQDLRVDYYDEVTLKLQKAKARYEDKNPPEFRAMVGAFHVSVSHSSCVLVLHL